ncbi:MAG: InlB B-repeat-containing protein [Dysgonamonadaceae bacterium]
MKKYLSTLIVAAITLFAACSNDDDKTVYTVMFETGGGTPVPAAQKIEEGSTASAPSTNPEKAGYAFVYWHLNGSTTAYNNYDTYRIV